MRFSSLFLSSLFLSSLSFVFCFSDPVDIKGVTAPQHGSFMRITKNEYKMLQKWDKELKNKAK